MTGHAALCRSTGRAKLGTHAVLAALALLLLAAPSSIQPSLAQPTSADPASAQPSLPKPLNGSLAPDSAVIGGGQTRGAAATPAKSPRSSRVSLHRGRRAARRGGSYGEPLERPALAGVELVAPIPVPVQPPHFTVPVPAYPLENAATFYTTPLPPVICHRVPRDPYAPDPHLIRETTVLCEADNP